MINFNGAIVSRGEEGVQRGKKETNKVEIPRVEGIEGKF